MKRLIFNYIAILSGLAIAAFGVVAFVLPSGVVIGSATGLSRIALHYFGIQVSYSIAVINIVLFLLGAFILGKRFAMSIAVSTFAYPVFINLFERVEAIKNLTEDTLLLTLYGGVLIGLGVGLVIKFGASTGGTDVIAIILNKKTGLPIAATLYVLDFLVVLGQISFASSFESILLGIMMLFLCSLVADKVIVSGGSALQLIIISPKSEQIRHMLLENMFVGVTVLSGRTGYTERPLDTLLCITSKSRLNAVQNAILKIDEEAFIIINPVKEVKGRGFTFDVGVVHAMREEQIKKLSGK